MKKCKHKKKKMKKNENFPISSAARVNLSRIVTCNSDSRFNYQVSVSPPVHKDSTNM